MESWTVAQGASAVKSLYKNNDSHFAARREFRKKFGVHRNSKVPSAHTIKTWVNNFEETGSTVKKKGVSVKTFRTLQKIDAVRASFEQSPRRSAVRHSKKLCCVDKKNQLDVTSCIVYFSSNSCSTCLGQPCAHHQELTTA